MGPDRESFFVERRQVPIGAGQTARLRRVCPLQQRVSSDARKEVSDILRNEKSGTTGISLVFRQRRRRAIYFRASQKVVFRGRLYFKERFYMKAKNTKNITAAIFLGLILGILFGLFMPGRYDFLLPAVELVCLTALWVYTSVSTRCAIWAPPAAMCWATWHVLWQ